MKTPDSNTTLEQEEQAALWAARLDGDVLEASARLELDSWLETDPHHRILLSEYCQLSADLEAKLTVLLAEGRLDIPAIASETPSPRRHRAWWAWSTGLAAAAALVLAFWLHHPGSQMENMATPTAERASHDLADGSHIVMDARTSLRVDIDDTHRRMQLAEGEVFFAVAKDPERPFVVETPAGSVRVKGTHFDVRSMGNSSLQVTVEEGIVQVNPAETQGTSHPVILTIGDQMVLDNGNMAIHHLSPHQVEDALAWRHGEVVFKNAPLREVLARFARHHGIGITAGPKAATLRIGGRYSLDDLNGFFADLEEIVPVRVTRSLGGTYHVNIRPQSATGTDKGK